MSQKLLKASSENIPEQTTVSLRSLKDVVVNTTTVPTHTIDCANLDYIRLNLKHDAVIAFTGATKDGQQIVLALVQDDIVPHTVSYTDSVRLGTDIFSIPLLSIELGKLDRIVFMYDAVANKYDLCGYSRGY